MVKFIFITYCAFIALSFILYIPKLRQFFSTFYRTPHLKASKKRRIALVIPARDESRVIGDLFASIKKQTYDRDFFDVNVIVKDINDPTVAMARAIGANVFVAENQNCKGDALDSFFKQVARDKFLSYDAFVIVDADAYLSSDYVEELNNALEYDIQIFLSRKYVKNYLGDRKKRSLYSNCSVLTYPQLDDLCNNYRTKHNIPMNMCGQGMMIRRDVIEKIDGWPYRTLTEDYELRMDCFLKGFSSMYYPYAVIYTEEVLTHKESYKRRLRWVTGFSQCDRKYKKEIKKQAKARGKLTEGEFEFFYMLFPVILYIVATIITAFLGLGLTVFYAIHGLYSWLSALLQLVVFPVCLSYGLVFLYCLLCMLAYRDVFCAITLHERIAMLFFAPLFCYEYFPIFIKSRIYSRAGMEWEPTQHIEYDGGVSDDKNSSGDKDK